MGVRQDVGLASVQGSIDGGKMIDFPSGRTRKGEGGEEGKEGGDGKADHDDGLGLEDLEDQKNCDLAALFEGVGGKSGSFRWKTSLGARWGRENRCWT